jgi:hypothetical protein
MATDLSTSQTGLSTVFSGSDVVVIFGNEYVGECMSFTLGINREAGPLYVMGKKSPIAIPKGKRGIGGSFVLAQLGYDALLQYCNSIISDPSKAQVWVRKDEVAIQMNGAGNDAAKNPNLSAVNANVQGSIASAKTNLWENVLDPANNASIGYADQIPPFNITLVGINEQGDQMGMRVYGVTILNDGFGVSIDDLNIEKRYTFVATAASRMAKLF